MEKIAIIGMSCQLASARNYEEFWSVLETGKDCIKEITGSRWSEKYYNKNITEKKSSVSKWCGALEDCSSFDNAFFGISPKEAKAMDPQQRLLLQETYHAIEDTCEPLNFFQKKKTAVFVANMAIDYQENICKAEQQIEAYSASGTFECMLANRLSYFFDFNGRSEVVNAACASSLVAIHNARLALQNCECDIAIVGAVNLNINPFKYISFGKARMLSPDGRCKPFDYSANGYVPGDGVAIIILEKQTVAETYKHRIHGIIDGSETRHNGKTLSLTSPRIASQADLLEKTWKSSGIDVSQLSYIEAHGTGTSLGDPIEIEGIKSAFDHFDHQNNTCYVGSVKSNIGHLEACAGLAGLIKVVLMMKYKKIVPTINIEKINPIINMLDTHIKIANRLEDWSPQNTDILRAGISSFGFGGVNAHVVISSYHKEKKLSEIEKVTPFILSAKTEESLKVLVSNWVKKVTVTEEVQNLSYSLIRQQTSLAYKLGFSYASKNELLLKLQQEKIVKTETGIYETLWLGDTLNPGLFEFLQKNDANYYKIYQDNKTKLAQLKSDVSLEEQKRVERFIQILSLGENILKECPHFRQIGGEGYGKYASIVLSGVCDRQEMAFWLLHKKIENKVKLPEHYLLIDATKEIDPDFINEYLLELKLDANENKEWFSVYSEHYKQLRNTQFTFKKNLLEWREVCKANELDFYDIFSENELRLEGIEGWKETLIQLIIISAWKKLNRKWEITSLDVPNAFVNEISELISEKIISKEEVPALISGKKINDSFKQDFNVFCLSFSDRNLTQLPLLKRIINDRWNHSYFRTYLNKEQKIPKEVVIIGNTAGKETENRYHFNPSKLSKSDWIDFWIDLWKQGSTINFERYFNIKGDIVSIPKYPFKKTTYFTPIFTEGEGLKEPIILDKKIDPTVIIDPNFNCNISKTWREDILAIKDHIIADRVLIPGALLMSEGIKVISQSKFAQIKGSVQFLKPSFVEKELIIDFIAKNNGFQWKQGNEILTKGTFHVIKEKSTLKQDVFQLSDYDEIILSKNPYPYLKKIGYQFGASLQTIKGIKKITTDYFFDIETTTESLDEYELNPLLLDGILQAGLLAGSYEFSAVKERNENTKELLVPFYIKNFSFHAPIVQKVKLRIKTSKYSKSGLEVDIHVFDEKKLIASLLGVGYSWVTVANWSSMKKENVSLKEQVPLSYIQEKEGKKKEVFQNDIKILTPEFIEVEKQIEISNVKEAFIIILSPINVETLIRTLSNTYARIKIIVTSEIYDNIKSQISIEEKIDVKQVEWIDITEEEFRSFLKKEFSNPLEEIQGYIAINTNIKVSKTEFLETYVYTIFHLIKSLSRIRTIKKAKLFIPIYGSDTLKSKEVYGLMTAYFGLSKALEEERSKIEVLPLYIENTPEEKVISYYKNAKITKLDQKLLRRMISGKLYEQKWKLEQEIKTPYTIEKGTTMLVVGGMGGVGFEIVKYLALEQQVNVLVIGRRAKDEHITNKINTLKSSQYNIAYKSLDICIEKDVDSYFEKLKAENKTIQGIIYCAGTTADSLLNFKTKSQIEKVVSPKFTGLLNIDQYTREMPLKFFVTLSSIVSVIGNTGQTDYAFANGFIDSFSTYRNSLGRPGSTMTINLGLVGTGMGNQDIVVSRFKSRNIYPIDAALLPTYIMKALSLRKNQVIISNGYPFDSGSNYLISTKKDKIMKPNKQVDNSTVVKELIKKALSKILEIEIDLLDEDVEFSDLGVDSIAIMDIIDVMADDFDEALDHSYLIEYPTIKSLTKVLEPLFISKDEESDQSFETPVGKDFMVDEIINDITKHKEHIPEIKTPISGQELEKDAIAVIGMSCIFPGAQNLEIFQENLKKGVSSIGEFPKDRIDAEAYNNTFNSSNSTVYTNKAGIIDGIEYFDADHFKLGVDPSMVDPQQRLFIEVVQDLFRDMGYENEEINGKDISLYVGGHESDYYKKKDETSKYVGRNGVTNVIPNMIAARVSHHFNLKGSAEMVYTACSSSLVAIKNACNSLIAGETSIAIAGGIELLLDEEWFTGFCESGVLAKDGKCKAFDQQADGFTLGEGAGVVALKRYKDAVRDGDNIQAVIKGAAVNNDGHTLGLTTPNRKSQEELIKKVLEKSNIAPDTIGYYEAHGTGTQLGDPIEIKSVTNVYKEHTTQTNYCGVGSVKTNIGHLLSAAGIASFIKTVLSVKSGYLFPTLNCNQPNPKFNIEASPFFIVNEYQPWKTPSPRRAALSSFGFGGTNCHLIVEEFKPQYDNKELRKPLEKYIYNKTHYPLQEIKKDQIKEIEKLLKELVKGEIGIQEISHKLI